MGAGCKPAGFCLRWFESNTLHQPERQPQEHAAPQATQTDDQGPMPSTSTSLMARERASRAGLDRARVPSGTERSGLVCRFPAGVAQLVERQPSKLNVASSSLVSRSVLFLDFGAPTPKSVPTSESDGRQAPCRGVSGAPTSAHLAQLVEHVLGKDEVVGSIPMVGSTECSASSRPKIRTV